MSHDPIVDEVRQWRENYARKFDYDLEAICCDLREKQKASNHQIVSFAPKPVRVTKSK